MHQFINICEIRHFDGMIQGKNVPITCIGSDSYIDINLLTAEQLRTVILNLIETPCISEVLYILVKMYDGSEHEIFLPGIKPSVLELKNAIQLKTGIVPYQQIIHISRQPIPLSPELLPMISLLDEEPIDSDEEKKSDNDNSSDVFMIEGKNHIQLQPGDEIMLGIQSMTRIYLPEESVAVLDDFGDCRSQWRSAVVIQHRVQNQVRIHYCGWSNYYNTTLDLNTERDQRRIARDTTLRDDQGYINKFIKDGFPVFHMPSTRGVFTNEIRMGSRIVSFEENQLTDEQIVIENNYSRNLHE